MGDKARFHTLDAMRGVAALCVFILHGYMFFGALNIPGGYLAVDLFFALSGFVIAHAYEGKLAAGMGTRAFAVARLIRLYPLYLVGAVAGTVDALLTLATHHGGLGAGGTAIGVVTLLAILPSPTWDLVPPITPVNGPAWSLFFEIVANIVYAALLRRIGTRWLCGVVAACGVWLAWGIVATGSGKVGMLWENFVYGAPRVGYSFFAGVLLYRLHKARAGEGARVRVTPLAWAYPFVLVPLLAVDPRSRPLYDAVCVLFVFPPLVYLASWGEPRRIGVFALLGATSYALYAIHYPVLHLLRAGLRALGHDPTALAPWAGLLLLPPAIAACWAIDRWYDVPVRRWLTRQARERRGRRAPPVMAAMPATPPAG